MSASSPVSVQEMPHTDRNHLLHASYPGDQAVERLVQSGTMKQWMDQGQVFCSYREVEVGEHNEVLKTIQVEKAPSPDQM